MQYLRQLLDARGVITTAALAQVEDGTRVWVGGAVATAGESTYLNLEDETGMANVPVSPGSWQRNRVVARASTALLIRGRVQAAEGAATLIADRIDARDLSMATAPSRDFRRPPGPARRRLQGLKSTSFSRWTLRLRFICAAEMRLAIWVVVVDTPE